MAVKSNKNTLITRRFKAALAFIMKGNGISNAELAKKMQVGTGTISNFLKSGASAASMEDAANALGIDLIDMLAIGRDILAKKAPEASNPPSPKAEITPERELELLRENRELRKELDQYRLSEQEEGRTGTSRTVATGASSRTARDEKWEEE